MRIYPVKRPLCAAIVAFIAGLWLSSAQALPWMGCVFCLLAVGIFCFATKRTRLFFVCLLTLAGGFLLMQQTTTAHQALVPLHGEEAAITATITRAPADRTYVDAEVTAIDDAMLAEPVPLRIQRAWEDETDYTVHAG